MPAPALLAQDLEPGARGASLPSAAMASSGATAGFTTTSSPGAHAVDCGPTAATTPATSQPGTCGNRPRPAPGEPEVHVVERGGDRAHGDIVGPDLGVGIVPYRYEPGESSRIHAFTSGHGTARRRLWAMLGMGAALPACQWPRSPTRSAHGRVACSARLLRPRRAGRRARHGPTACRPARGLAVEVHRERPLEVELHRRHPALVDARVRDVGAVPQRGREPGAARSTGRSASSTSRRPSSGWPRGATSHAPRNSAFMAATTRPRHQPRRATRWATNQWRRPSTSTAPRSTGSCTASAERSRASSPRPPRVRHRSPPSRPSGGTGSPARRAALTTPGPRRRDRTTTPSAAAAPVVAPRLTLRDRHPAPLPVVVDLERGGAATTPRNSASAAGRAARGGGGDGRDVADLAAGGR